MKKKLKFNRILWIRSVFLVALMILLPNKATLQLRPPGIEDLPPLEHYQREGNPKMESVLYRLMKIYFTQGIEEAKEFAEQRGIDMQGDLVRVVTEAKSPVAKEKADTASYGRNSYLGKIRGQRDNLQASLLQSVSMQIEAFGGKVETTHRRLIQSVVPLYALQEVANFSSVRYLRLPRKPIPLVTSEGVAKTGADQWHIVNSYRQTEGAKVCILDIGFQGYNALLGTELPSSVTTRSFRADGDIYASTDHGTACAEIVHDMAPNAELWLVNSSTDVEHGNAVDWIISQGVDIISYSVGWKNVGAGDGTGPICEDVEKAVNSGITWVGAAGNHAEKHWEDTFNDTDVDFWHNFSGADQILEFVVPADTLALVALNWDDWGAWDGASYSGSNQDYDLYLFVWDGIAFQLRDFSLNTQNGTQLPVEVVGGMVSFTTIWGIVIEKFSATRDVKMEIFVEGSPLPIEYYEPTGSLLIPADSPYAVTVGAVDWSDDTYHTYSSQGPTSDGRIKPDLCAPSGVSTESKGATGFSGTSASAPHVAGAFALLKGKLPYTLDQINSILEARAKDLGAGGKDNQYGYGRLNLLKEAEDGVQLIEEEKDHKVGLTMNKKGEQIIFEDEPKISVVKRRKPISFEAHKSMGLLYLQQDLKEKALEEFLRAIELEPLNPGPYFEVGKIYQEIGWKRKAIEHYEKFLDLWKNADSGIAEVEDARKRLAGLKSQ